LRRMKRRLLLEKCTQSMQNNELLQSQVSATAA
jgi:hypothetical protein